MNRGDRLGLGVVGLIGLVGAVWIALELRDADQPVQHTDQGEPEARAPQAPSRANVERIPAVEPHAAPAASTGAEWTRRNQQGIEALREGRFAEAVAHFEACMLAEPDEPVFSGNLAEALARLALAEYAERDTRASAIAHLARAVELAPTREDLSALLERWRKTAETEDGYWTDETEHFSLSFDGSRAELMHGTGPLTEELERAYQDYGELFGRFPVEEGAPKIEVVLYRRAEFRQLTGLGHWAGGAFDGVVRIPVEDLGAERRALIETARHELVHAYVAALGARSIPAWLNEGLAQWLAPEAGGRALAVQRARALLSDGELFPLADLQSTIAAWDDDSKIRRAYAQSLAFVAWLHDWYGERLLFELVMGATEGKTVAETFRAKLFLELDDVLGDLSADLVI
jgi:tetratricopeptide (TPR) repeat protein